MYTSPLPLPRCVQAILRRASLVVCISLLLLPVPSLAQGITFVSATRTIVSGLTGSPFFQTPYVAADSHGNLYLPDPASGSVVKETPSGSGFIQSTVLTGFKSPAFVAVDNNGNVYAADTDDGGTKPVVYKATPSGGSYTKTMVAAFMHPELEALAVDGNGNVYVLTTRGLFKETPSAGTYIESTVSNVPGCCGLAVDASGNFYTSDYNTHAVYKTPLNGTPITVSNNFRYPRGVAVDAAGHVYVSDENAAIVYKETLDGGTYTQTPIAVAITGSDGIAVDGFGNVYFADEAQQELGVIEEVQPGPVDFGSVNVCPAGQTTPTPCSQTLSLGYIFDSPVTFASVKVSTQGATGLDFQMLSAGGFGNAISYQVAFGPDAPGLRSGALQFIAQNGTVLATTPIHGVGIAPAIAFSPAPALDVASGFNQPRAIAVDSSGNLFIADKQNNAVKEVLAAGGYTTVHSLGSGFNHPVAVALDGAGNVFVDDFGQTAVKEILAVGGYSTVQTLADFAGYGLALDGNGNVFAADSAEGSVKEIMAASGYTTTVTVNSTGGLASGLVLDAHDNLFLGFQGGGIEELTAASGYKTEATISDAYGGAGLALDASGNIFVSGSGSSSPDAVYELVAAGGYTTVNTLGTNFSSPQGVALDSTGNLFVAESNASRIREIQRSQPPVLDFPAKSPGSSSSPRSVVFQNVGNAALTGSGILSDTADFTQVAGSGTPPDCTPDTLSLAPGTECNLSVEFTPKSAGAVQAAITLTDNALNAAAPNAAIQTVNLVNGGGPKAQLSATTLNFSNVNVPGSKTLVLTITNAGLGTLTVNPGKINGPSFAVTQNSCGAGIGAGVACTLNVTFTPVDVGPKSDLFAISTNGPTNPVVRLTGLGAGVGARVTTLQFGTIPVGATEVLPLRIYSQGRSYLEVVDGFASTSSAYKAVSDDCNLGISPGGYCTVQIQFKPTSARDYPASFLITSSSNSSTSVSLSGSGAQIAPTTSGSLDFGTIALGATKTLSLALENYGLPGSPVLSFTINGPSYKILPGSNCSSGLPSGSTCTLQVEFDPVDAAPHNDVLTIYENGQPTSSKVQLVGMATTP